MNIDKVSYFVYVYVKTKLSVQFIIITMVVLLYR